MNASEKNSLPFNVNDRVEGIHCGYFVVVGVKRSVSIAAGWIISVRELGPANQIGNQIMRFPADVLRLSART